jgi:hypothetical protein
MAPTGLKGKLTVLNGAEKSEADLVVAGDKLEAKGVKLAKGAKVVAALVTPAEGDHGPLHRQVSGPCHPSPARPAGGLLALLAAALFGVSTPLVQQFGVGLGAFSTAALLYAGAAAVGLLSRQRIDREARLQRSDLPRLLAMAGSAPSSARWRWPGGCSTPAAPAPR